MSRIAKLEYISCRYSPGRVQQDICIGSDTCHSRGCCLELGPQGFGCTSRRIDDPQVSVDYGCNRGGRNTSPESQRLRPHTQERPEAPRTSNVAEHAFLFERLLHKTCYTKLYYEGSIGNGGNMAYVFQSNVHEYTSCREMFTVTEVQT